MSQHIEIVRLKQPCEHLRCKAKRAYWEDGRLYCREGHRQDIQVDRDVPKFMLLTDNLP